MGHAPPSTLEAIEQSGVVAVIRADRADRLEGICRSLVVGGVVACEITMTSPGALEAIEQVSESLGREVIVGVGSVLDAETARMAILAGAQFVVSPILAPEIVETAHRYGRPVIIGALTPTEIQQAATAGADAIKVFPANHFGPRYFKDLHGPMPHLKLTPTGGVNLDTIPDWVEAGAAFVGVGSALVRKDIVEAADWDALEQLAREHVAAVDQTRSQIAT